MGLGFGALVKYQKFQFQLKILFYFREFPKHKKKQLVDPSQMGNFAIN